MQYLCIELENGVKSSKVWYNIMEKLEARISGWKDKWLTKTGKITNIRSVLMIIPTYLVSCLPLLKHLNHKLETSLWNFL